MITDKCLPVFLSSSYIADRFEFSCCNHCCIFKPGTVRLLPFHKGHCFSGQSRIGSNPTEGQPDILQSTVLHSDRDRRINGRDIDSSTFCSFHHILKVIAFFRERNENRSDEFTPLENCFFIIEVVFTQFDSPSSSC